MDQLLSDFLGEAKVLIAGLADDVDALRSGYQDGRTRRELVGRIFRHAHTLKGSSAALELNSVAELTHEFETLLDGVRSGRSILNESVIATFEDTVSAISKMLEEVANENRPVMPTSLVENIRNTAQLTKSEVDESSDRLGFALPPEIVGILSEDEEYRIREALSEGAGAFIIDVEFDMATFDTRFKELCEVLREDGEIIATQPGVGVSEDDQIAFRILYVSDLHIDRLTTMLEHASPRELRELIARSDIEKQDTVNNANVEGSADTVPVSRTVARAVRAGTVAARATGKEIDIEIHGGDVRIGKSISDAIVNPLLHLLRNAVDHGIESPSERASKGKSLRGLIRLEALVEKNQMRLRIVDDGRGIDPKEITRAAIERGIIQRETQASPEVSFRIIFMPGFSTAESVSTMSGRGVGLDVVERAVEQIGGEIMVQSEVGVGTTFELVFPLVTPTGLS